MRGRERKKRRIVSVSYTHLDGPWIKIGDATDGDNTYLRSTKEHIIQEGVKKSRLVKAGSLIFANCGVSLGFARIITFDGCIHDGWLAMEDIDCLLYTSGRELQCDKGRKTDSVLRYI